MPLMIAERDINTWLSEETCDGLPEYTYQAEDGTTYQINLTEGWIWKESKFLWFFIQAITVGAGV